MFSDDKRDTYCTCTCDGMIYVIIDFTKQDLCSFWQLLVWSNCWNSSGNEYCSFIASLLN